MSLQMLKQQPDLIQTFAHSCDPDLSHSWKSIRIISIKTQNTLGYKPAS